MLAGLRRTMPTTSAAAGLAAASMAGIPLFGGFIAKEQLYDTIRNSPFPVTWGVVLTAAAVAASKRALLAWSHGASEEALAELDRDLQAVLFEHPDKFARMDAFLARRRPT